jgi:D-glycero-alpha-D-manno-heptose-7-phosphate kinase
MKITARAPMRIDLAGGTLDVYPLYIFEDGGLTVNAAIDVMASATVETRYDSRLRIHSVDLGIVEDIPSVDEMAVGTPLDLVRRALAYYRPPMGLNIVVRSEAPKGSGLGASSALLMALSVCLNEVSGKGLTPAKIIDVGANIEAQVIGIPTGKQDYFPPMFGGVCSIAFGLDGWRLETLSGEAGQPGLVAALNDRLVVSYTEISHSSAVTNWAMLRRYIENEGDSVARIREIKEIAVAMRAALAEADMAGLALLLDREWQLRRGLAEGVSTPKIEAIMAAAAGAGALASKICGAGGGGCLVTIAEPDALPAVREALAGAGARVMPARVVETGVHIERS